MAESSKEPKESMFQPLSSKLDDNNFIAWRKQVIARLRGHGLQKFIDQEAKPPNKFLSQSDEEKDQINPLFLDWEQQDQMVLSWMMSQLINPLVRRIVNCDTTKQAWEVLDIHFAQQARAQQARANVNQYEDQLASVKKDSLSVNHYLLKHQHQHRPLHELPGSELVTTPCTVDGAPLSRLFHSFIKNSHGGNPFRPAPLPLLGLSQDDKHRILNRTTIMARHIFADKGEEFINAQVKALLDSLGINKQAKGLEFSAMDAFRASDGLVSEFSQQQGGPESWAHSFEHQHGASGWASEFEQVYRGSNHYRSTNDQRVDEFSSLQINDSADIYGMQVGEVAFGEASTDSWANAYDEYLNEQRADSSRGVYEFAHVNPYVGHPNPMKEGQELFRKGLLSEAVLALEAEVLKSDNAEGWRLLGIAHDHQAIAARMRAQKG